MTDPARIACDVCVVGSGMAGMSAALFAANRGLATVLVGRTGEIIFATGLLDLLGVHPLEEGKTWSDPWAGMAALVKDLPRHPYARLAAGEIRAALDEVLRFFEANGLAYAGLPERNVVVPTAVGTLKTTYRVPQTMWQAVSAWERRAPCLLVDIQGLKGFSARQVADTLTPVWPGLQTARVVFPGTHAGSEVFAERLARSLELEKNREKFADALKPHVKGVDIVGLPAILGISKPVRVMQDIERRLGVALFEIPTMPPGATGLRLKETFESGLAACGVRLLLENKVFRAVCRFVRRISDRGRAQRRRTAHRGGLRHSGDRPFHGRWPPCGPPRRARDPVRSAGAPAGGARRLASPGFSRPEGPSRQPRRARDRR